MKQLRAEYIAQARTICMAATERIEDLGGETLEEIAVWSTAVTRA